MEFHLLKIADLISLFDTNSVTGLSAAQAQERLQYYGFNKCPHPQHFVSMRYLLTMSLYWIPYLIAVISFCTIHNLTLSPVYTIFFLTYIVTVLCCVLFYKKMSTLFIVPEADDLTCQVIRDNLKMSIAQTQLVPGDIMLLQAGACVPADARILHADSLIVQEFEITGIQGGVAKNNEIVEDDARIWDHTNMVYKASLILEGNATAVVVATGNKVQKVQWSKKQKESIHSKLLENKIKLLHNFFYKIVTISVFCTLISYFGHSYLCDINFFLCSVLVFAPFVAFLWTCYTWVKIVSICKISTSLKHIDYFFKKSYRNY